MSSSAPVADQSKEKDRGPMNLSSKRLQSDASATATTDASAPASSISYILFTCTYYASPDDLRFQQCLETLQAVEMMADLQMVVVDGSPTAVHEALQKRTSSSSNIVLSRQTSKGGKGMALREAATLASKLPGVTDDTFLCWLEPEKTSMVALWSSQAFLEDDDGPAAAGEKTTSRADVLVPYRSQRLFQTSYPIEQFHSETYGNFFLDTVMNQAIHKADDTTATIRAPILGRKLKAEREKSEHPIPAIDWHFGPFCFKAKHIQLWATYSGSSYDAQIVPIVHAMRKGLQIASVLVDFELGPKMKEQEQGNVDFIEKRLTQLSTLDPVVKKSWTDDFYC